MIRLSAKRLSMLRKRRRRSPLANRVDELAMNAAERHYAKSAALMAGAGKLLTDHIAHTSWGTEVTIDVSLQLLKEAKYYREVGNDQHRKGKAGAA